MRLAWVVFQDVMRAAYLGPEHPRDAPRPRIRDDVPVTDNTASTAAAIVDRYTEELYHQRNLDAVDELVAEPMIRHEPGGERLSLTRDDVRARTAAFHAQFRSMRFSTRIAVDDGTRVASAYEADLVDIDGDIHTICGIEIFTIVDGRITEVWNPPAGDGSWG